MPSAGPKSPSSIVSSGTGVSWSGPGNAGASDDSYASANMGASSVSRLLLATGFDFSELPDAGTPVGFLAEVECKWSAGFVGTPDDHTAQIVIGGVATGTNQALGDPIPNVDTYLSYGGATNLMGTSPTMAQVKAGDFGFAWAAQTNGSTARTVYVDHIRLTVYYTLPYEDVEAEGVTLSQGSAEISHVRYVEAEGVTLSQGSAELGRTRDVEVSGVTLSQGEAQIQGGSVRVEAEGVTLSQGSAEIGLVQRVEAEGVTLSQGDAEIGYVRYVEAEGVTLSEGAAELARFRDVELSGVTLSHGSAEIALANRVFGKRIRLDVYDPTTDALVLRVPVVIAAEYGLGQDQVGTLSLIVPATDARVSQLADGQRVVIFREGEGNVFTGYIEKSDLIETPDGGKLVTITGASRARELVWQNTLTGAKYEAMLLEDIADDLLPDAGWTSGEVEADPIGISLLSIGKSYWETLVEAAARKGWHIRENNLTRTLDIGPFGQSSGLVVRNISQAQGWNPEPLGVLPLIGIKVTEAQEELWNQIVPLGGGEGIYALTLQHATRSSPYTVKQGTDKQGLPYWYLEDEASVLAHKPRQRLVSFKDTVPLANSPGSIAAAADALYAQAAAWLGWHAWPVDSYEIEVANLRHYDHGQPVIRVGDTLRLIYIGVVDRDLPHSDLPRKWREIDQDLYVLDMARVFNEDGSDTWRLSVSTNDQRKPDDSSAIAEAVAKLHAVETSLRPFTMGDTTGPYREPVDSSHEATIQVVYDDNVTYLKQAKLTILVRPVRSNTKSLAAQSDQTSSSGGSATSQAGGSHSHNISATSTASASPEHVHTFATLKPTSTWVDPAYRQQFQAESSSGLFGFWVGRDGVQGSDVNIHTWASTATGHTHTISAQTSEVAGSHSHSISPHTHNIPGHNHALVYGVFQGPNPSNPNLRVTINGVDVTAALGGPWDDDVTLDITAYMTDEVEQVLRQTHTIEVSSDELADVILSVRSIITMMSIVPV